MTFLTFVVFIILVTLPAEAKLKTCENKDFDEVSQEVINKLGESQNRLSFKNYGGLLNGGVCWWHSRFERAAAYLAVFEPSLKKPGFKELNQIIRDITHLKAVKVPGYKNLRQFSFENKDLIQNALEDWQKRDGFINQAWVRGLFVGLPKNITPKMNPDRLKRHMEEIYETFQKSKKPIFLMLQMKGLGAHALLLLDVTRLEDLSGGNNEFFILKVIDSNVTDVDYYFYHYGDTSFRLWYSDKNFIPYTGLDRDFDHIRNSLSICKR